MSKIGKAQRIFFILIALLPFAFSGYVFMRNPVVFYVYAVMSAVCFVTYALDKWKAKKEKDRIPENYLHLLELLFGWPGALLAQRTVRHKTRKVKYQILFWGIVLLHLAGWMAYLSYLSSRVA